MFAWLTFLVSVALAGVDVNTADLSELQSLPGIGPSKAEAIIAYRNEHGPFTSLNDLDAVNGIGPSTLENLKDQVTFGKGAPPAKAAATGAAATGAAAAAPATRTPEPAAGAASCSVNINSADAAALQNLPGIGASKAEAILQFRTDNGPFASCDGLDAVNGIGTATLAGLRDCCVVK